ncbi:MAG: UvrB/UvrC motif-containing protein, partial [Flavobacteriaceae bacterium]
VILDADKEGFLRSTRSLTQTIGRAARHVEGLAIMYADKMTKSMQATIDATNYRREKQMAYNEKYGITPTPIKKSLDNALTKRQKIATEALEQSLVTDQEMAYLSKPELEKKIRETRKMMEESAKSLDFVAAAKHRDTLKMLQKNLSES